MLDDSRVSVIVTNSGIRDVIISFRLAKQTTRSYGSIADGDDIPFEQYVNKTRHKQNTCPFRGGQVSQPFLAFTGKSDPVPLRRFAPLPEEG